MTSSIACRSSDPGATFAIAASSFGSRRGSSSDGVRVKPRAAPVLSSRLASLGSIAIESAPDRSAQGLLAPHGDLAMRRRTCRGQNLGETELAALLETPLRLGRRAETTGKTDLAERAEAVAHGNAAGR